MSTEEYTSTKPLWHALGWRNSTKNFLNTIFNNAEKYYYEEIIIKVIDGPFNGFDGNLTRKVSSEHDVIQKTTSVSLTVT